MWLKGAAMAADSAVRRLKHVHGVLGRVFCSASGDEVSIGSVQVPVVPPKRPELVPIRHMPPDPSQGVLRHLRWIMQKDLLGQDVFLIGAPGPLRRQLAMRYCELTSREVEYVSLSRDTTESDLKQRREIHGGSAFYVDQPAVRAAIEGRILILEGIEKAERNVLPVLNNLLENREMQLDDGRFLMSATRYDELLKTKTKEELESWNLVRVSERFRVIALGLPVPFYRGNPLDPPLRSRFQGRDIRQLSFDEYLNNLQLLAGNVERESLSNLLSVANTLSSSQSKEIGLPGFPLDSLECAAAVLKGAPLVSIADVFRRLYPYEIFLKPEGQASVVEAFNQFKLEQELKKAFPYRMDDIQFRKPNEEEDVYVADVSLSGISGSQSVLTVPAGSAGKRLSTAASDMFVATDYHKEFITSVLTSHAAADFCIIGPRGCGKTAVVRHLADLLGYRCESVLLYQDMIARDLLQQRMTLPNGDTAWRLSPLVSAALAGNLAVLDGLHRVNTGTLAVLQRLIQDRELSLFDGSRLLRHDRYAELKDSTGLTDEQLTERGILRIHPSFRIIAILEPPQIGTSKPSWLTAELLSMFLYHPMRSLLKAEEELILSIVAPGVAKETVSALVELAHGLRREKDPAMASMASSLSTRQLLRIVHRMEHFDDNNLCAAVHKACLSRFLPMLARTMLDSSIERACILPPKDPTFVPELTWEKANGQLRIGSTVVPLGVHAAEVKVPDVLFYDNQQHLQVLEEILKDFVLGEHLLLVGNQGVGKNKIIDRFLYLMDRPREYIQLHRDTTVQSLTLQPTVQDGRITYEDSPLVRALKCGHVLVVDEADKAPTHVTFILKALVERGEITLGDGRRVVTGQSSSSANGANVIVSHPNFRLVVLANRPGFPFLGNDFFASLGDMFSCHAIDNPDRASEMAMLRQYGPDVPAEILERLISSFSELRGLADDGLISYPYSTREVVNIVRHLQKFRDEGLPPVVRNVFDFDRYHPELIEQLVLVMQKHGIPLAATAADVILAERNPLSPSKDIALIVVEPDITECHWDEMPIQIKGPQSIYTESIPLDMVEERSQHFTECSRSWQLPLTINNSIVAVSSSPGKLDSELFVASASPMGIFHFGIHDSKATYAQLYHFFPRAWQSSCRLNIAALHGALQGQAILHEENTDELLLLDVKRCEARRVAFSKSQPATLRLPFLKSSNSSEPTKMYTELIANNQVVLFVPESSVIQLLDVAHGRLFALTLPFAATGLHILSADRWLIEGSGQSRYILSNIEGQSSSVLQRMVVEPSIENFSVNWMSPALEKSKSAVLDNIMPNSHIVVNNSGQVMAAVGLSSEAPGRLCSLLNEQAGVVSRPAWLPDASQLIQVINSSLLPKEKRDRPVGNFLRVLNVQYGYVSHVPLPSSDKEPAPFSQAALKGSAVELHALPNGDIVTVQNTGQTRLWQLGATSLDRALTDWKKMVGQGGENEKYPLKVKRRQHTKRDSNKDVSKPKHGKVDKKNEPHVGGNTWAGGTGGRDTAGLGGKGGPYRLDAGHEVFQVSDEEKAAVPEEVRRAARAMGQKAYKKRLEEIDMSEHDAELYESLSSRVRQEVRALRVILDSLQAKQKERAWLKHQSTGELDDAKLIEGLTGEKDIYKRRGENDPELHQPLQKPKRLRLVVDVSGSMYHFNGADGRLEREMQSVLMMLEAFEKHEDRFKYDIIGQSGESDNIPFVEAGKPPVNDKERLHVLLNMHAHAQYCITGDNTLSALKRSIRAIAKEEADEHFVVLLSDANLERYGYSGTKFVQTLNSEPEVQAFIIFIGSLGQQAERLSSMLPAGRSYMCMDTTELPKILHRIFSTSILQS